MTPELVAVTLLVVDVLHGLGVPYAIGGSLASTFHGKARTTVDSDLVAELRLEQVEPFVNQLKVAFYVDESSVREAIEHRRSFNVIHLGSAYKVDIFIPRDRDFDRAQLSNAKAQIVATDPERMARMATPEDTILAKLEWYRLGGEQSERQWRDVRGIIEVQGERLDRDYMESQATGLGVEDLLQRALSD